LDQEPVKQHEAYAGKRIKRGLFMTSDGRVINADVNGSLNILRKEVPNAFADGIEAVVVRPKRMEMRLNSSMKNYSQAFS
jgi:putative transposase